MIKDIIFWDNDKASMLGSLESCSLMGGGIWGEETAAAAGGG